MLRRAHSTPPKLRLWVFAFALLIHATVQAATFVVTSTADTAGSTCASSCTLRQAITAANATTAADTINFGITLPVRGELLIQPASALPTITQPLTINGYSQSGTRVNDDPVLTNAQLRIRIDGVNAGADVAGLTVCAANVTLRGLVVTRFAADGIRVGGVSGCLASQVAIRGNFLGITNTSNSAPNVGSALFLRADTLVGSVSPADRNVLIGSTIATSAIVQINSGTNSILGNLIGMDRTGLARSSRVSIGLATNVSGQELGSVVAPNRIACREVGFDLNTGASGSANAMSANYFFPAENNCQPIDLAADGVTPNDPNDTDTGPNGLQNFPVITAASRVAGGVSLTASLDVGHPGSSAYDIALYASSACSSNGHGPGERLLGITSRNISSTVENFTYTQSTSDPLPPGTVITATATRTGVGTSEMSACFFLDPPPLVVNAADDVADGLCNAVHCSLRDAINVANLSTRPQQIHFAVPPLSGTSEILIQPATTLPDITQTVTIDGYTQPGTSVNTDPVFSNAVLRIRLGRVTNQPGIRLCGANSLIRGVSITGSGNAGIVTCATGISIKGNFFGIRADGLQQSIGGNALRIENAGTELGGTALEDRNVLCSGVIVTSGGDGARIVGNLLGSTKTGSPLNSCGGITLQAAVDGVRIGSNAAPNRFGGGLDTRGIDTFPTTGNNNEFASNIFSGLGIGIDLGTDGITPNDPGDNDTGPNELINFPELTLAERNANGLRLSGTVSRTSATLVTAYANSVCGPGGHGRGEVLLGQEVVTSSNNSFNIQINTDVDLNAFPIITATTTFLGSTSELSQCITATDPPPGIAVDTTTDGAPNAGCDIVGDGNSCTLREAITLANTQSGADLIRFEIPGDGPHVINLGSQLPVITGATTIDGYTQNGALPNASAVGSDAVLKIEVRANGQANVFRTCTSEVVELRGLALSGGAVSIVSTRINDSASCSANGSLVVRGNWLGLTASGGSLTNAISVLNSETVLTLGGTSLADRNLIANAATGVRIAGQSSSGAQVLNNVFGVSPELTGGAAFDNTRDLELFNVSNVTVGGEGNASNRFEGSLMAIGVLTAASDNNSLYGNTFVNHPTATAIDLSDAATTDGITPNDIDDVDTGANEGQNTPVLASGSATANSITINGTLDVPAGLASSTNYRLAFYRSPTCNDSPQGREGAEYLGSVLQGFLSNAENFTVSLNGAPSGGFITATATSPTGSTSEFSNCLVVPRPEQVFKHGFED